MSMLWVMGIGSNLILLAAIIGAVFTLIIFTSSSYKHHVTSLSVYLRFAVVVETVSLFVWVFMKTDDLVTVTTGHDAYVFRKLETCILFYGILMMTHMAAIWITIATITDRYISIARPHLRQKWNTKTRALIICLIILFASLLIELINVLLNIENVIKAYNEHGFCYTDTTIHAIWFALTVKFGFGLIIPMIVIVVMSVLLHRAVNRMSLAADSDLHPTSGDTDIHHVRRTCLAVAIMGYVMVASLLTITIAFIVLFCVMNGAHHNGNSLGIAFAVGNLLVLFAYGNKFYVLIITNYVYRNDVRMIFTRCKSRGQTQFERNDEENDFDTDDTGLTQI